MGHLLLPRKGTISKHAILKRQVYRLCFQALVYSVALEFSLFTVHTEITKAIMSVNPIILFRLLKRYEVNDYLLMSIFSSTKTTILFISYATNFAI